MVISLLISVIMLCQPLYAGIKTVKDYTASNKLIPADSDVLLLGTKNSVWYELFDGRKSAGFVQQDCVNIQGEFLVLGKECSVYSKPMDGTFQAKYSSGRRFKNFLLVNNSESEIMFASQKYTIPSDMLRFVRPTQMDKESYDLVSIEAVVKLKRENVLISPYIDKTMYVSAMLGVFTSLDGKTWYRLKKLDLRKYAIAVTKEGWLVADTMVSKDFGKNFEEFFPSFAEPYKDAYVKGILVSPQGVDAIYLTFSSKTSPGNMTLYMLVSPEQGWRKIYPATDGAAITVPAEDTLSSVLKFINNKWLKNNKYSQKGRVDIEDIDVGGIGSSRTVSMMVTTAIEGKKKNYHVSLSVNYDLVRGWSIKQEKWSFI